MFGGALLTGNQRMTANKSRKEEKLNNGERMTGYKVIFMVPGNVILVLADCGV